MISYFLDLHLRYLVWFHGEDLAQKKEYDETAMDKMCRVFVVYLFPYVIAGLVVVLPICATVGLATTLGVGTTVVTSEEPPPIVGDVVVEQVDGVWEITCECPVEKDGDR